MDCGIGVSGDGLLLFACSGAAGEDLLSFVCSGAVAVAVGLLCDGVRGTGLPALVCAGLSGDGFAVLVCIGVTGAGLANVCFPCVEGGISVAGDGLACGDRGVPGFVAPSDGLVVGAPSSGALAGAGVLLRQLLRG